MTKKGAIYKVQICFRAWDRAEKIELEYEEKPFVVCIKNKAMLMIRKETGCLTSFITEIIIEKQKNNGKGGLIHTYRYKLDTNKIRSKTIF